MKIYIGWDSKQSAANEVCEYSLHKYSRYPLTTKFLKRQELEESGIYYREVGDPASTEFTYTRFLVPHLENHKGWSMFVDNDFLFTADITSLFDRISREPDADDKAVYVVKHLPYIPRRETKFWGYKQLAFPRKNWTSLIIFNNSHPSCRKLTPLTVANQSPQWLHRLKWCADHEIGDISYSWNWLVGEYGKHKYQRGIGEVIPKGLHFTNGGPWNDEWGQDYEELWLDMYREMTGLPYGK